MLALRTPPLDCMTPLQHDIMSTHTSTWATRMAAHFGGFCSLIRARICPCFAYSEDRSRASAFKPNRLYASLLGAPKNFSLIAVAIVAAAPLLSNAQNAVLRKITISPETPQVGQQIQIVVDGTNGTAYCAVAVEYFLDGQRQPFQDRARMKRDDSSGKLPYVFSRVFEKPGVYEAKAKGTTIGLAFPCEGETETRFTVTAAGAAPVATSSSAALLQSAEQGDAEAMYTMGYIAATSGRDVEAVEWFRKAASAGHVKAMNALGFMYDQGRGTPQNYAQASRYYASAIRKGNADAMMNAGRMHFNGRGVEKNVGRAYAYFSVAAAVTADPDTRAEAVKWRDHAASLLSQPQLLQAQKAAEQLAQSIEK
jgi:hypothetical protein